MTRNSLFWLCFGVLLFVVIDFLQLYRTYQAYELRRNAQLMDEAWGQANDDWQRAFDANDHNAEEEALRRGYCALAHKQFPYTTHCNPWRTK